MIFIEEAAAAVVVVAAIALACSNGGSINYGEAVEAVAVVVIAASHALRYGRWE